MKKIVTLLFIIVFTLTTKAQTDEAMLKWLINHSAAINIKESSSQASYNSPYNGYFTDFKFDKTGIKAIGAAKSYFNALSRKYFKEATIDNNFLILKGRPDGITKLSISDPVIRLQFKEVLTRFAYTRLNTNETDLPVYDSSKVEKKAVFPGGQEAWQNFLLKYLTFDAAIKHDVPPGNYAATISFVVTKDSLLKDFKKMGNNPKGIDETLLTLMLKVPQWIPATLNGNNVSSTVLVRMTIKIKARNPDDDIDMMEKAHVELYYKPIDINMFNYETDIPGYKGLKPLNLDENSNTPSIQTKNDNSVKQPVVNKEKTTYVNPERKKIEVQTSTLFMNIELFSEGYAAIAYGKDEISKKWGFINSEGKLVIQPKYSYVGFFSGGLAPAELNNQYGYIDKTGAVKIPFTYRWAGSFQDGLAKVGNGDKIGFINHSGEAVIPLKYDEANEYFNEGMVGVRKDGKWGFIDIEGKVVVPIKYDYVTSFYDGLARVILNKKYGFINKSGEEVIPLKYDGSSNFSENLAQVKLNNKYGFIDKSGNEVIPIKYDDTGFSFENGSVEIEENKMEGLIDRKGNLLTPVKYDIIDRFSEGLAQFWLGDKKGFIDHQGQEVIPAKYEIAGKFSEGLIRVYLKDKWGYINKDDKLVIPFRYNDANDFLGGIAQVEINGQKFIINKAGQKVIPKLQ